MDNFSFHNPVKIIFGRDRIDSLTTEIPKNAKVFLTYGGGSIKANGLYDRVKQVLSSYRVIEFGGITANPQLSQLEKAISLARSEAIDFLLAVGGGSVIDASKFIAAVPYSGDPWDILAKQVSLETAIPLGTILTIPATGSEMNSFFVIGKESSQEKLVGQNSLVYPRFSILDPTVTFSLPLKQISNGVVDAFVHTLEQYLTYQVNSPLQDRMAESILQTLIVEGPKTLAAPKNYESRANIMWCATMALNGAIGVGVPHDWSTHNIAHQLTALFGIDHARTLAIVLPSLLNRRRHYKRDKLLQYAANVWQINGLNEEEAIDRAIFMTKNFFESLGVPTCLKAYGLGERAIEQIVKHLSSSESLAWGEQHNIEIEDVRQILLDSIAPSLVTTKN